MGENGNNNKERRKEHQSIKEIETGEKQCVAFEGRAVLFLWKRWQNFGLTNKLRGIFVRTLPINSALEFGF